MLENSVSPQVPIQEANQLFEHYRSQEQRQQSPE